jgi:hypothetical protein
MNMKRALKPFLFIWLAVWSMLGIMVLASTPGQMIKDKMFIEDKIIPSIIIVDDFKKKHNRLPTKSEFDSLALSEHLGTRIITSNIELVNEENDELHKYKIPDSDSYVLAVWRGEWNEYYVSWLNKFIGNNYNWREGFKGLLMCAMTGIVPFALYVIIKRVHNQPLKRIGEKRPSPPA